MLGRSDYPLEGRHALLVVDKDYLKLLAPMGITSSPVYAKVHKADDGGLWLEHPRFPLCPPDRPRLYTADGEAFCAAHVFVPYEGVVSVAVFQQHVPELADSTQIGFRHKAGKRG